MWGYMGPAPPAGPAHKYIFDLYALDVENLDLDFNSRSEDFYRAIEGHVIQSARLVGLFANNSQLITE